GATAEALFFPPSKLITILRLRRAFERIGRTLWPAFSGFIIVEAQKRLYQGLPVAARASRRARREVRLAKQICQLTAGIGSARTEGRMLHACPD
ncbi:hypothetical protein ACC733_37450, partial [Rhizobium johnstonii]